MVAPKAFSSSSGFRAISLILLSGPSWSLGRPGRVNPVYFFNGPPGETAPWALSSSPLGLTGSPLRSFSSSCPRAGTAATSANPPSTSRIVCSVRIFRDIPFLAILSVPGLAQGRPHEAGLSRTVRLLLAHSVPVADWKHPVLQSVSLPLHRDASGDE